MVGSNCFSPSQLHRANCPPTGLGKPKPDPVGRRAVVNPTSNMNGWEIAD